MYSVIDVVDFVESDEKFERNFEENQNEKNKRGNFYIKNTFFIKNRAQSRT